MIDKNGNSKASDMATKQSRLEIINALKHNFATTVRRIYINSLDKEIGFREISVQEQKTLSRIMIDNENRKDVVYDAQCAIINKVALDDDFDIYQLSEFDKIKLLIALYQANMVKTDVQFTCKECGTDNKYKLEFEQTLKHLDNFDISDKPFEFENAMWQFKFVVGYPEVNRVSEFYKSYAAKYRKATNKNEIQKLNTQINLDYVDLFIKSVTIVNKGTGAEQSIDLTEFLPDEAVELISTFPQDVVYVSDGVMKFISDEYIEKINTTFEKRKCLTCGAENTDIGKEDSNSFL